MLNYTNKIERETQERSSNIELLRILSMFLVLMIHYIPSRTLPTHDTLAHDTLGTLFDLQLRSISFVCVNCFILISGYFGIRWKLKSFSNLLFQILFMKRPVRLWTNGMTQRSTDILVRQNGKTVPVPGRTGQPARLAVRKMRLRLPHIGSR